MNNKIANQKVEVPNGIALNDKDYINSLLSCLKEMEKNYAIALTEVSNEFLYEKYKNVFLKIIALQRKTYELMFKFGWYQLEKVEENKITTKYNMLLNEYNSLS